MAEEKENIVRAGETRPEGSPGLPHAYAGPQGRTVGPTSDNAKDPQQHPALAIGALGRSHEHPITGLPWRPSPRRSVHGRTEAW